MKESLFYLSEVIGSIFCLFPRSISNEDLSKEIDLIPLRSLEQIRDSFSDAIRIVNNELQQETPTSKTSFLKTTNTM